MLKILVTAVIGLAAFSVNAQNGFSIKGKISARHNGQKVMLEYNTRTKQIKDSAVVRNGAFSFKGKVNEVVKAYLALRPLKERKGPPTLDYILSRNDQDFFLENKNFTVQGANIYTAQIKGGPAQTDFLQLKAQLNALEVKSRSLSEQMIRSRFNKKEEENDEEAPNEFAPKLQLIYTEMARIQDAFIQHHPDSYVSLYLINERNEGAIEPAKLEPALNALSPRMKGTAAGKNLQARLEMAKKTDIGQQAMDFTQNNTKGEPVSLSSLKGKYVLVDFWASWCSPCRAENPEVLKAYQKFKDRNFEIIAISLDDKKEPWLKAIETDGLPWLQVSDLKGWQNAVARLYGVTSVPQNFLLGPDGKILAKNLRGEELQKELEKILN